MLLSLAALALLGNNDLPPSKYQGNAVPSVIVIVNDTNDDGTCFKAPEGYIIRGCTRFTKNGVPIIILPNPCFFPEAQDEMSYAHLLCHEFGHVNGWNSEHNN